MKGRPGQARAWNFRPENLGQNAIAKNGNVCFVLFVVGVLVFTILAATYQLEDPFFHPSTKIMSFLTSDTNSTFRSDDTMVKMERILWQLIKLFASFINRTDVEATAVPDDGFECDGDVNKPIDCKDPEVFHMMLSFAIDNFKDIHIYRFGKPVRGSNDST